jgi:uncharacterized membrane protein
MEKNIFKTNENKTSRRKHQSLGWIFLSLTLLFSFQNCAVVGDKKASQNQSEQAATALATQDKAMSVIQSRCVSCHNPAMPSGGIDYIADVGSLLGSGLVVPRYPDLSPLYTAIAQGEMPPSRPLAQDEVDAINAWIKTGFDTPAGGVVVTPPAANNTLQPKFSSIMTNVFKMKCLSCHSAAGGNKGGVNLETYNAVKNYVVAGVPAQSILLTALKPGGKMNGRASGLDISTINDWIAAGAKND